MGKFKIKILSDNPEEIKENIKFDFHAYKKTFVDIISSNDNETPLVIGLEGRWGRGKTTLMKAIMNELKEYDKEKIKEGQRRCKSVWFQAWKYNDADNLLAALLENIVQEMGRGNFFEKAEIDIKKLWDKLNLKAIPEFLVDYIPFLKGFSNIIKEEDYKKNLPYFNLFSTFLKQLIRLWIHCEDSFKITDGESIGVGEIDDKKGVVVIFIDDLDRCNKENIVKVLEAVKLFLDFRGCIFVMGVSIEIIVKATSSVAHCEDGSEYLEKMIQVSYGLPPIHQDDMKIYFEEKISLFSYNDILNKYSDVIIKSFGDRITPRKIKQFINNLNLQIKISDNKGLFEKDFYDENNNKIILKIDHYIYWNILKEAFRINFDSIKDNTDIIKMTQTAYKENEAQIKNSNFENIDKIRYEVVKDILKNQMLREIVINLPDNAEIINILKFESLAVGQIHIETEDMKGMREHYRSGAMVKIEKGPFLYTEEKIKEKIDYDYEIDIFPVTNEEYCKFLDIKKPDKKELDNWISLEGRIKEKDGKYIVEKCYEKHPIIYVSWYGAKEYAKWMKKRLPEEKEWEKAARGPNGWIYPWGDEFDKGKCNTSESNNNDTTEVDKYPNGKSYYGCYDMAGNVWEWTDSWYDKNMDSKVLRGGSWYYDQEYARCADRDRYLPEYRNLDIGFRCARTL